MKELTHMNLTSLLAYYYSNDEKVWIFVKIPDDFYQKKDDVYLNCVMEYVPENMYRIIRYYRKINTNFPTILLKIYSYQLLRSLAYIHGKGICHRDIKPQNVLVNPRSHLVKLCDFGSAKKLVRGQQNVAYICSRYYRAPELIFGATEYSNAIDVWSTGCVIAEMILGRPIFPGSSSIRQLIEIIKVLGSPTKEDIFTMNPHCREHKLPKIKNQKLKKVCFYFKY